MSRKIHSMTMYYGILYVIDPSDIFIIQFNGPPQPPPLCVPSTFGDIMSQAGNRIEIAI